MSAVESVYVRWGTEQIEFVQGVRFGLLDQVMAFLTRFGEAPILLALALGVLVFRRNGRDLALWLLVAFALSSAINAVLKGLLTVPRPDDAEVWTVSTAHGFSTPSAHTMMAAAVWILAALSLGRGWTRYTMLAVPFVVGLTRVYLGMHYPADTIIGLSLGALIAVGLWQARMLAGTIANAPAARRAGLQAARLVAAAVTTR